MNYQKITTNGYILGIGETTGTGNITAQEYTEITKLFQNKPAAAVGFEHKLRDDTLEWELVPVEPTDTDIEDAEALAIILGGAT